MLNLETFKTVIASTPLVSIDLIIRNDKGQVLLGKRINKPAQGCWFVPGGRVLKDELFKSAFDRILRTELGISAGKGDFIGIYEHFYENNFTGTGFSTHYIVLAYEVYLTRLLENMPIDQHSEYRWYSIEDLLADCNVHQHTKWYFQKLTPADTSVTK